MIPMEQRVIEQLREQGYEVFQNGWPDLLVRRDGEFRAIEVKAKTDQLRRAQVAMHEALADFGMDVEVVTLDRLGRIQPRPNCPQEGKRTPRMSTPRSNIVRLRLTDLEKQDWQTAAGGARKLSEWVRATCNAAAEMEREPGRTLEPFEELTALGAQAKLEEAKLPLKIPVIPNAKPEIVAAVIERETRAPAQCDRWMHHRPGVYCGSCKRVVGK